MNIEIKKVGDGWVVLVGDLKFHCTTRKEAEHLEAMLRFKKNAALLECLMQHWDDDILKALQTQHMIFKAMIFAMLELDVVIWSNGMAAAQIWVAVDFCEGLHNAIHQPAAPAPAPRM